jgi:hypothetical protein
MLLLDGEVVRRGDRCGIPPTQVLESLCGGERPRGVGHGTSCDGLRGRLKLYGESNTGILRYAGPTPADPGRDGGRGMDRACIALPGTMQWAA